MSKFVLILLGCLASAPALAGRHDLSVGIEGDWRDAYRVAHRMIDECFVAKDQFGLSKQVVGASFDPILEVGTVSLTMTSPFGASSMLDVVVSPTGVTIRPNAIGYRGRARLAAALLPQWLAGGDSCKTSD